MSRILYIIIYNITGNYSITILEVILCIHLSIYIIECVCLFVVNAKTTERIDAKRSGITKNDPESVLYGLKLPVFVLLGRYNISGFPFAPTAIFTSTSGSRVDASQKTASTARHVAKLREPSRLERKCYC